MGSGEHHHFGSSKCLCSFRRGLYLGVCLALVGLVGRTSRRFLPSLLLISSRKIGTPRKEVGKSDDSSTNSSSAEEGADEADEADETLSQSAWSSCLE